MTDLTAAVEAAARALGEATHTAPAGWSMRANAGDWFRTHQAAAAVAAAAPILRAQVLAEAREAVEAEVVDGVVDVTERTYNAGLASAAATIDALGAEGAQ